MSQKVQRRTEKKEPCKYVKPEIRSERIFKPGLETGPLAICNTESVGWYWNICRG
jgi:hypothetical protein